MSAPGNAVVVALAVIALMVIYALVSTAITRVKVRELRGRGIYPEEGRAAEADVLCLLRAGEKIMAIRCYRELHKVGLKQAKAAVELLAAKNNQPITGTDTLSAKNSRWEK